MKNETQKTEIQKRIEDLVTNGRGYNGKSGNFNYLLYDDPLEVEGPDSNSYRQFLHEAEQRFASYFNAAASA
ncbi:hypothetical protein HZA97_05985 [Candidatus Woesearchaeota archaeon]|nr:hypothetical protein [Candidatus Woesearchaeota archaeon]